MPVRPQSCSDNKSHFRHVCQVPRRHSSPGGLWWVGSEQSKQGNRHPALIESTTPDQSAAHQPQEWTKLLRTLSEVTAKWSPSRVMVLSLVQPKMYLKFLKNFVWCFLMHYFWYSVHTCWVNQLGFSYTEVLLYCTHKKVDSVQGSSYSFCFIWTFTRTWDQVSLVLCDPSHSHQQIFKTHYWVCRWFYKCYSINPPFLSKLCSSKDMSILSTFCGSNRLYRYRCVFLQDLTPAQLVNQVWPTVSKQPSFFFCFFSPRVALLKLKLF